VLENFRDYKKSVTDLVTPYGLRTLSPSDKKFVGIYWGDQCSRDRAYHNGTICHGSLVPMYPLLFVQALARIALELISVLS